MDSIITGGCIFGAIRYESKVNPESSFICQCRLCQRSTGTGHATAFAIDRDIYSDFKQSWDYVDPALPHN